LCISGEIVVLEKEVIFSVDEVTEGGYQAKAFGFSIFTEANTFEDLKKMFPDAVLCHFGEKDRQKVIRLHYPREKLLAA